MTTPIALVMLMFAFGCSNNKPSVDDCETRCGNPSQLDIVDDECNTIQHPRIRETCKLEAFEAFETCWSECD